MKYNVQFKNSFLGRTICLDNGEIEFAVSLNVGPRIIGFNKMGGTNVMYQDIDDLVNKDCSEVYGAGKKWHIYGGHRLWLSPEDLSTYYPDNLPVCYKLTDNGILVYPNKWEIVDVQMQILIEFVQENKLKITHKVQNLAAKRKLCLWALTVAKAGGKMIFELPSQDTNFLPNRNIVLWPYSSLDDKRAQITDKHILAKSSVRVTKPFKVGAYNKKIRAEYILEEGNKTTTFVKEAQGFDHQIYPDFHCNFECYFNDKIHEIETLSGIQEVDTGQEIEHIEYWEIY